MIGTRAASVWSRVLHHLVRQRHGRIVISPGPIITRHFAPYARGKVALPKEFARRPTYVPLYGLALLPIPLGMFAAAVYYEWMYYPTIDKQRQDAFASVADIVDLPTE